MKQRDLTRLSLPGRRPWLLVAALLLLLFAAESVAVYQGFTSHVTGANDFYPRWAGARALLVDGRDPYSRAVTQEIETVLDPRQRRTNSFNFAFPLPVIFLFWPLVYLPYAWAQAFWLVTIQFAALATVLAVLGWQRERPSPLAVAAISLATLLFYPVSRTLLLGQFTLHVTLFLAASLWLLRQERDGWAGLSLSLTIIKPQMVVLILPWLALWAMGRRRWRFLAGLAGGGGLLLAASLLLQPDWPLGFWRGLSDYAAVAGGRDPLQVLLDALWPGGAAPGMVRSGALVVLVAALLSAWWYGWRSESVHDGRFRFALFVTIAISLMAFFQTGTTNQVLVLLPLLPAAYWSWRRLGPMPTVLAAVMLLGGLWWLFAATLDGNAESDWLFLPLPLLLLLGLATGFRWRAPHLARREVVP